MAEYIKREATCKDCFHYCVCKDTVADENWEWEEDAPKEVREMFSPRGCKNYVPAADVVEVVRCKGCKNYIPYTEDDIKDGRVVKGTDGVCLLRIDANAENLFVAVSNNDFCSYGAKKDEKEV